MGDRFRNSWTGDDGDDRVLVLWSSGFLVGWTWSITAPVSHDGTPGSRPRESDGDVCVRGPVLVNYRDMGRFEMVSDRLLSLTLDFSVVMI